MRYKQDFVTNSSSTCFFFLFRGGKQGFFDALANHAEEFNLSHDHWDDELVTINVGHIVRELEPLLESKEINIIPIESLINDFRERIYNYQQYMDESEKEGRYSLNDLYQESIDAMSKMLHKTVSAAKSGLTHSLVVGFGDNDGEVSGRGVGTIMDYEGRDLNIDDHDLVIMTEQNR